MSYSLKFVDGLVCQICGLPKKEGRLWCHICDAQLSNRGQEPLIALPWDNHARLTFANEFLKALTKTCLYERCQKEKVSSASWHTIGVLFCESHACKYIYCPNPRDEADPYCEHHMKMDNRTRTGVNLTRKWHGYDK